jgi:hypothetical protein
MLALIVMYVGFKYFNANVGGLFSVEYADAPWGWISLWICSNTCQSSPLCWALEHRADDPNYAFKPAG